MTAPTMITPERQCFTVVDLANTFFCVPLHRRLHPLFAFTYNGQQYTYRRLPQGFSLTPGISSTILKSVLLKLSPLPEKTLLLQYVDDLLIAASHSLLRRLGDLGFKVKKDKLQLCRHRVTFLGVVVPGRGPEIENPH